MVARSNQHREFVCSGRAGAAQSARGSAPAEPPGRLLGLPATVQRILRTHAATAADGRPTLLEIGIVAALSAVTIIRAPWVDPSVLRGCRQCVERKAQGRHGEKRGTHGFLPLSTINQLRRPAPCLHRGSASTGGARAYVGTPTPIRQFGNGSISTAVTRVIRHLIIYWTSWLVRGSQAASPPARLGAGLSRRSKVVVARKEGCNDRETLSSYE